MFEDRLFDWSHHEQVRLHELYSRFSKQLAHELLVNEQYDQAISVLKRLLKYNEWDEQANLLLLQVYENMEDKVSFMLHYEHISKLYEQELSIPMSDKFTKLYERFYLYAE